MHFTPTLFAVATLLTAALGQDGSLGAGKKQYNLKTKLKPNQNGKDQFDSLYLQPYHTGAGLNDVVFTKKQSGASPGFLNGTNGRSGDIVYRNQVFDLGSEFPWIMIPETYDVAYSSWQPVRINAGSGGNRPKANSGFYFNATGLQWTSAPHQKPGGAVNEFGGWLVCNWWHQNEPQLFFRMKYYNPSPIPSSCADVYLMPQYL